MLQTLLALLCALRCSHLVAVRPQDGLHQELGNAHHKSAAVGGLTQALAVGGSATLQRDGDRKRQSSRGPKGGPGVPSTDDRTRGSTVDSKAGAEEKTSADDQKGGLPVDSKSSADEKSVSVPVTSPSQESKSSADEKSVAVPVTSPSQESADEKDEVNAAENANAKKAEVQTNAVPVTNPSPESSDATKAGEQPNAVPVTRPSPESADAKKAGVQTNAVPVTRPSPESADAKKEGVQTNSPSDASLATAQKGLTEGHAGAAPTHENEHQAAAPVALTTNDDLSDSIPEKSPVAVLVGDVTVGTMKDNDEDGQATQQLDDIIWDVEELQRIAWKVGARLGTFYTDEGYRHVIVNVVVYLAGVFIALGLYFMCFQHREVSSEQEFRYGLCECFGDVRVSLCGIFCPAIRWADTVSEEKGGFLSFSYALALMMGLGLLAFRPIIGVFAWVAIVVIGVYYRQRIREKYGLEVDTTPSLVEDFFVWCCCSYCALVQEARQVDDFEGRKNSEYTEESDDFKQGTLRLSETDTGTSW